MKRCPACSRTYEDDTLSFCLEDGSVLSAAFDEVQTVVRGAEDTVLIHNDSAFRPVRPTAESLPPNSTAAPSSNSIFPHLLYASTGLLGLVIIGLIIGGVLWFRSGDVANVSNTKGNSNRSNSNVVVVPTPTIAVPSPTAEIRSSDKLGLRQIETALDGTRITFYQQPSLSRCESDCADNPICKGYTWIVAGTYNPGDAAMCYLMSSVTKTNGAKGHVSAVKGMP
ncbi:MAG TPA: hypothetical protein PKA82_05080 [Pyrinomonadaceae bacterium]|nr:hypothetical protein [Pyrinomonadaceae bacterium]